MGQGEGKEPSTGRQLTPQKAAVVKAEASLSQKPGASVSPTCAALAEALGHLSLFS